MSLLRCLVIFAFLTSCAHEWAPCLMQHPIDGKANRSCKRGKAAKEFCSHGAGELESFSYWSVRCK